MFDALFEGECNKDASLTLLTMFETITGREKTTGSERERAIDELYKAVLAPVYRADTIANLHNYRKAILEKVRAEKFAGDISVADEVLIAEAAADLEKPLCIDVGSRKFFFVDDDFIAELERMGYAPEIIYMNLDIEKNLNNLFSIRNDKYVISDRLNLTGVTKTYLESLILSGTETIDGVNLKELANGITSSDNSIREASYISLTRLSEENPKLKEGIRAAIKEYMIVRQNTLGEQFKELSEGTKSRYVHGIEITMADNPDTVYGKMKKALSLPSEVSKFSLSDSEFVPVSNFGQFKSTSILLGFSVERPFNTLSIFPKLQVKLPVFDEQQEPLPLFDIVKHKEREVTSPELGQFTRKFSSQALMISAELLQ